LVVSDVQVTYGKPAASQPAAASNHVRLVVLLPDLTPTEAPLRCLTQLASDARVGISIECSTCSTRQLAYWQHRSSRRCVEPQRTSISPQDKEESNMGRSAVSAAAVCAFFLYLGSLA
jgi:hypothetical protein